MMVRIKNTARKVFKPPLPVVPYRCAVCQLTFNHRQSLSRHYKQQHKLPNVWDQLGGQTPMSASQTASLWSSLSVSVPLLSTRQLSAPLSSAPLLIGYRRHRGGVKGRPTLPSGGSVQVLWKDETSGQVVKGDVHSCKYIRFVSCVICIP